MAKKILIIDDDQQFIETVFKPKLSQWEINYDILSNRTFKDIDETSLSDFAKEVISIIEEIRDDLSAIFLDLRLNTKEEGRPLGFRLGRSIRDIFFEIPIIALTALGDSETMEDAHLYDFDRYITKPKFGNLGSVKFNGMLLQAIRKREDFVEKIPQYYNKLKMERKELQSTVTAFQRTFSSPSENLENELKDIVSIHKKFDEMKRQTVILFADLCNSTSIKQKAGFIEGLYITRLHNEIITDIIHKMEGKVIKYIGDCVMARFDYDDTTTVDSNAIKAAIQINEALSFHNKRYRKDSDDKILTKIGISVGTVIDFYGNDPQGSCVDLAARLESLAKPQQIIISAPLQGLINVTDISSSYGQADSRAEYLNGPFDVSLKGFKEKQKVYEVFWAKDKIGIVTN